MMQIGVSFPQSYIGSDPAVIRDFAKTAEDLGFTHITLFDHVLGAAALQGSDVAHLYTNERMFHEVLTTISFFAGVTSRIAFATAVLVLPQRQTVLVAKQAAQIDVLSGGRFRLGVGLGWNEVEFEALGENIRNRGRRIEEQIEVLRRLWTEDLVSFEGRWHKVTDAGLNPVPVQRPIPIWIGALASERALRRVGRLADGWFVDARVGPDDKFRQLHELVRAGALEAGREPDSLGIEATIFAHTGGPDEWHGLVAEWQALGATHITFRTSESGLTYPDGHLDAMRRFMSAA